MRGFISFIAFLVLMHGVTVQVFADTDMHDKQPSSWAIEQVSAAITENLVPTELQSGFTQAITRAEFAVLAVILYETIAGEVVWHDIHIEPLFIDTDDIRVEKAAHLGIVFGVGNNRFNPDEALTREQAAVMLARLADVIGMPFPNNPPETFDDTSIISSWAVDAVDQMRTMGIMDGVGNNIFEPQQSYTREQSIVTILRLFELVADHDTAELTLTTTHTVAVGETFVSIAMLHYGNTYLETLNRILEANGMSAYASFSLFPGQILIIPAIIDEPIEYNGIHDVEFVLEHHSRRIWLNTHQHQIPHAIARSTEELQRFTENYIFGHWVNYMSDIEQYFSETVSKFNDAFFEEQMLIFAYVETSTGAAIAEISRITYNELGVMSLYITTSIPGYEPGMAVTADIGNHLLIASLPQLETNRLIVVTYWGY